jgi:hypothetical protein
MIVPSQPASPAAASRRCGHCRATSHNAAWCSATSSCCSAIRAWSSGMVSASCACLAACGPRTARRTRARSRRVVVPSHPGRAAGSRILSSWSTGCSQTLWPTSSAPSRRRRCLRQMDQISGAYRSTSVSRACLSRFLARAIRSVTDGSSLIGLSLSGRAAMSGWVLVQETGRFRLVTRPGDGSGPAAARRVGARRAPGFMSPGNRCCWAEQGRMKIRRSSRGALSA